MSAPIKALIERSKRHLPNFSDITSSSGFSLPLSILLKVIRTNSTGSCFMQSATGAISFERGFLGVSDDWDWRENAL